MGWIGMGCLAPSKSFHVKIILLDKQELIQEVQGRTSGQDLLDNIYKHLNLIETAYFGLRYQDNNNQTHWLDPNKKVSQQIKGVSPITLYLGVKFYAADPCKLAEEITRYQFYLQVKLDILQGRLPVQEELSTELAALALQSELGDYDGSRHSRGYSSEFRFLATQSEDMEQRIEDIHRRLVGLQPAQAENRYLEKVKWLDMYGVDLHHVIGDDNIEYFLGLTPSGIIVLRNRNKVGNYFCYLCTFSVLSANEESTYGFETPSRQACKHLWKCCVEHHAFFRLVQVSPAFTTSGVLGLGSRLRSSGRSEKDVSQEINRRNPPNFTRVPSQRYSRRNKPEDQDSRSSSNTAERNITNGGIKSPTRFKLKEFMIKTIDPQFFGSMNLDQLLLFELLYQPIWTIIF
ncbi:band 4.1-like protein 4 [Eurytemora carolleeae]|uniref:band 4.1-like protein 4 n=1 Tax=Eurytemora carolleeae TaxID=1294199 RepID=UPI000C790289|nr:band 4.1-like protein 4 [Eurytemora carolleeae]|eukprot:XP_023322945.1 band 4.1-like protein 4 [Eurytemora affinis]